MTILVIGNGFDIAHDLPTSYLEFLDFVKAYKGNAVECTTQMKEFIDGLKKDDSILAKEVRELMSNRNGLLNHFMTVYKERCEDGKDGWIDFERELSEIVQNLERLEDEEKNAIDGNYRSFAPSKYLVKKLANIINIDSRLSDTEMPKRFSLEFFCDYPNRILTELSEITRLLEIYLHNYVGELTVSKKLKVIKELGEIDYVINFNYTDTFQKVYNNCKTKCCYIHGRAKSSSCLSDCKLVLGIDEYLDDNRKDNDNRFVRYKKFYQRIYKDTSSDYIDWLNEHAELNKAYCNSAPMIMDIYFYGHSLDVTDKDILSKLILHDNSRIHIFYHNKDAKAKQIENLVKIIGEDNLIKMTRGKNRAIEFLSVDGIDN